MAKPHLSRMDPFRTIWKQEEHNILDSLNHPLSGYIGGNPRAGYWVERLSEEWAGAFGAKYAIPCNSATSGLLAACIAVGIRPGDEVWTTPYSMSATAACAKVLGANVKFIDIEDLRFGIDPSLLDTALMGTRPIGVIPPKAVIVTNLFGHPARLKQIREWCDKHDVWMIEDNAQAPFAMEDSRYTGTIGHIGVFSLNVHKHIQCGEGGVIVTNDTGLIDRIDNAINHGELAKARPSIGLNLRMTEPIAAIACSQLAKAEGIIEGRRQIGLALCDMVKDIPWIVAHEDDEGCKHVYYLWTALIKKPVHAYFAMKLIERGIPIRIGYAPPLNRLFNSKDKCPVAADINNHIIVFEVCAHDVREHHLKQMSDIIHQEAEEIDKNDTEERTADSGLYL